MVQAGKTFRVFVSSTFSDLKAERNALQENVFPRLRELCAQHGARFQAIDLRWGVSDEAALDQQTMNICLGEIERCQQTSPLPNFVVLLGERYGWCPPPPQIPATEFEAMLAHITGSDHDLLTTWYRRDENAVPAEYLLQPRQRGSKYEQYASWEAVERKVHGILASAAERLGMNEESRLKYFASATHQEIAAGALKVEDAPEHVFCFLRTIKGLPQDVRARDFLDLDLSGKRDQEASSRLAGLQGELDRFLQGNVRKYNAKWVKDGITGDHLNRLCDDVYTSLAGIILKELATGEAIDALETEISAHNSFREERAKFFTGRRSILLDIGEYIRSGSRQPLALWGESGSGKSAVLAKAVEQTLETLPGAEVIERYIGATPGSSNIRSLLEDLCQHINSVYDQEPFAASSDFNELVLAFHERLRLATAEKPLLIFLDALDQLLETDNAHRLVWLPSTLPGHVKLVVSTLPEPYNCLPALRQKLPSQNLSELQALSIQDGEMALNAWLKAAGRGLQTEQRQEVLSKFARDGLPLYLKLAFEEARRWRSYDGLPQYEGMPGLAEAVPGIISNLFWRLSQSTNHGEMLISRSLGYLAAAKNGLSEDELLDVLSRDDEVLEDFLRRSPLSPRVARLPVVLWSRLYFDLQPYLAERSADGSFLITFYHRQLGEFVHKNYLHDEKELSRRHSALSHYFEMQSLHIESNERRAPNLRKLSELPYQQASAKQWQQIEGTLSNFDFLHTKIEAVGPQYLIEDYQVAFDAGLDSQPLQIIQDALTLSAHVLNDYPAQTGSQLAGRLLSNDEPIIRDLLKQALSYGRPWFRPLTTCLIPPGGPLLRTLVGHRAPVAGVSFAADGKSIISSSKDGAARVWDSETGEALEVITDKDEAENAWRNAEDRGKIDRDPNNRWSDVLAYDIVELQDEGGDFSKVTLIGHNRKITSYAFSPDGTKLVTGGEDNTVRVWELTGGSDENILEHPRGVTAVAAARDGTRAVSGGVDGTLRVWDLKTGVMLNTLVGHRDRINAIAIISDGQRAISASSDSTLKVWDLLNGAELLSLTGHKGKVVALAVSPDGQRAVSAADDKTLKAWDLSSGRELSSVEGPQSLDPAIAIAPYGQMSAVAYRDRTLRVWNLDSPALISTCIGHINKVNAVAFSPDSRRIVSGGDDQTLRIWDATTGIGRATLRGHWDSVRALEFADNDRLISLGEDDTVRVWDLRSGQEVHRLGGRKVDPTRLSLPPAALRTGIYPNKPATASATADGKRAISFYVNDDTVRLWDLEKGEQIAAFTNDFVLACCAITDDSSVVAGTLNGKIHLLQLEGMGCRSYK